MDYQGLLFFLSPPIFLAAATIAGRSWVLLLPILFWGTYFAGFEEGWWGYGFADGWGIVFVIWSSISMAAVALGLLVRWFIDRRTRHSANGPPPGGT